MTISKVAAMYGVTPRMLRHYEKIGLMRTQRMDDNDYRVYDDECVNRLKQIVLLRKLRIPLKQIAIILDGAQDMAYLAVKDNLMEIEDEIMSLDSVRVALKLLLKRFMTTSPDRLFEDTSLIGMIDALEPEKPIIREGTHMPDLRIDHVSSKNFDVRLIMLPPFTVASAHYIGENCEEKVGNIMDKFVRESKLYELKPDSRTFGFNHPNPIDFDAIHGYEIWVTIPDDMEVPEPLAKKRFEGGLYAVHAIDFPNFNEWIDLTNWVKQSDRFEENYSPMGMEIQAGCLEEHLNWVYSCHTGWPKNGIDGKIDLMLPIKFK